MRPTSDPEGRRTDAGRSDDPARLRPRKDDRLKPLIAADRLVGADFVETPSLSLPGPFAEFEDRGGEAAGGDLVERVEVEVDSDQCEEATGLAVARPVNLVVPVGLIPSQSFGGVEPAQRRDEAGLKQLAMEPELLAGGVDVHLLDEQANRTPEDQPDDEQAYRKNAQHDEVVHTQIPAESP